MDEAKRVGVLAHPSCGKNCSGEQEGRSQHHQQSL